MQETASAFSTKTLFINLKVYSSKTKNTEAVHQTKTVTSSPLMTEWAWPVIKLPQAPSIWSQIFPCVLPHGKNSPLHLPWTFRNLDDLNQRETWMLDVGSGLNILEIIFCPCFWCLSIFLLCRMYGCPFWWFWSWEVSVAIRIYTIPSSTLGFNMVVEECCRKTMDVSVFFFGAESSEEF